MGPTEAQLRVFEAYKETGYHVKETAQVLGLTQSGVKKTLFNGHINGLTVPTQFCKHLPAGIGMTGASVYVNKEGEVSGWYKGDALKHSPEEMSAFLRQRTPISNFKAPRQKKSCNKNHMLEWPVFDAHHGMLAWAEETGADYDHKISRHLQVSAGKILFQSFGRVKKTTLIFGGDNQTADNRAGTTEKSGNHLDTDSRYQKMAWCSYEATVSCIEIAALNSEEVYVVVLSGNHDWHSAIHLTIQLHAHFRNVKKVKIDVSPEEHRFYSWGNTVFMATHGDTPEKRIPAFALQRAIRKGYAVNPDMKMYVRMGHLHKRGKKVPDLLVEEDGVHIERFPTLAAQEAYSVKGAYTSCRATEANLWHRKNGRTGGREITIGEILERYPL